MACDAITLSPYLGVGALEPAFELCSQHHAGAFVLALTSNPEAPPLQNAVIASGRSVAEQVLDEIGTRNAGAAPLGSLGVVVGATIGSTQCSFEQLGGPILSPGVGAQGGTADDVRRLFGAALPAVLPSVSREVLRHGPDIAALRAAVERQIEQFAFLRS